MKSESSKDLATIVHSGRPKPVRKWIITILAVLAVIGGFLYYRAKSAQDEGKPVFVTEPLKRGDISLGITATGNLQPTNKVTVSSELSGICEAVYVDTNDEVTKGQDIAKLDTRKLNQQTEKTRATLAAAEARVQQSQATVRESAANLERLEDLHKLSGGRTPSKAEMETAHAAADRAKADLENLSAAVSGAKADLLANESDLAKAIIKSPVNGVVLTRSLEVGQTVAASFNAPELFVIAEDLRKMELLVAVAEADVGKVESGQSASFTVDAWPGRTYTAKVKKISYGSTILDNVVTYQAELEVSNDDLTLRPGMTATATIDVANREQVLLVPATALRFQPQDPNSKADGPQQKKTFMQSITFQFPRRRGGRPPGGGREHGEGKSGMATVWVLKDGNPEMVSVKTGLSDGRNTEIITDEVKEGAPIIVRQILAPTKP
ncbi:efflux RND transporter periplasmic adaptor subunit [Luteolibacter sp. SL250]|uniref:efflux RND transporter periplasmic adaptor subunit n=1 Tax=Luteolibacter sp. SL250 TaxID=2995170 RepID=UPI0022721FAE|nr:efflux RND transporter periplasmic adaptor subunit [Luteolibacter sp. SL250]WAC21594.1 efflux RND transporter periplasmic adaptor subunit [Luteolibacter sp. SL250]